MHQSAPVSPAIDCLRATISGFLLPFFLTAAGGNTQAAHAAILSLIDAYSPTTITEVDLVGRIVGFSIVALDNLRLSMTQDLSDTKVLRYRSNAVSLSRASEQARKILRALQENQETSQEIPRPNIAPAPRQQPQPVRATTAAAPLVANAAKQDIETMKHEARIMLAAFSKQPASSGSAIRMPPDPASMIGSAVRTAIAEARRPSAV